MQPTLQHHARVDVADVLRGLAVMGIILLHSIEHFNFYSFPDTAGQGALLDFTDRAIWDGLFFLLGGKAYAIFALLSVLVSLFRTIISECGAMISVVDSAGDCCCCL